MLLDVRDGVCRDKRLFGRICSGRSRRLCLKRMEIGRFRRFIVDRHFKTFQIGGKRMAPTPAAGMAVSSAAVGAGAGAGSSTFPNDERAP